MSNRIAAFDAADRVDFAGWMQPAAAASRWTVLARTARDWLAQPQMALSAPLRRDLGLAADLRTGTALLDVEARRLGF